MGQHGCRGVILRYLLQELVVNLDRLFLQLLRGEDKQVEEVEIVRLEAVLDFLALRLPLPELEEQFLDEVDVDEVDQPRLEFPPQREQRLVEEAEVEVASEIEEELVLRGLLLQRALLLEVQAHERPDHCDPHPLPRPHAEAARGLATQPRHQPRLVAAGLGELVEHALRQAAGLGDRKSTSIAIWLLAQSATFPIRKDFGPRREYSSSISFAHSIGETDRYSAVRSSSNPFSSSIPQALWTMEVRLSWKRCDSKESSLAAAQRSGMFS